MQVNAKSRYLRFSPYKLRPIADIIRGKNVQYALDLLSTYAVKKVAPVYKVIASAAANAKQNAGLDAQNLFVQEIRVDEGPIHRYFKPGAMGRASIQRKRLSHISVTVATLGKED